MYREYSLLPCELLSLHRNQEQPGQTDWPPRVNAPISRQPRRDKGEQDDAVGNRRTKAVKLQRLERTGHELASQHRLVEQHQSSQSYQDAVRPDSLSTGPLGAIIGQPVQALVFELRGHSRLILTIRR